MDGSFISERKNVYVNTLDIYINRYIFFFLLAVLTKFLIIVDSMRLFLYVEEKFQIASPSFCM